MSYDSSWQQLTAARSAFSVPRGAGGCGRSWEELGGTSIGVAWHRWLDHPYHATLARGRTFPWAVHQAVRQVVHRVAKGYSSVMPCALCRIISQDFHNEWDEQSSGGLSE